MRAKYFPDGDVLNCNLKKGSSYTWQSIWAGIQTFKRGHIWRVGDGESINIWEDCWIPGSRNRRVMTPRANIVLTHVSELIDVELRTWDEELVRDIFWAIDAERILKSRRRTLFLGIVIRMGFSLLNQLIFKSGITNMEESFGGQVLL